MAGGRCTDAVVPGLVSGRGAGEQGAAALHELALEVGARQRGDEGEDGGGGGPVALLQLAAGRGRHVLHRLAHRLPQLARRLDTYTHTYQYFKTNTLFQKQEPFKYYLCRI